MPADEVDQWDIYFAYEPPTEVRLDRSFARLICAVYQAAGAKCKPKDFTVDYEYIQPSPDELRQKISGVMSLFTNHV